MKFFNLFIILPIKIYRYVISPYLGPSCRFLPTCSEYFIDCVNHNGPIKGSLLGIKRILKCHPIKFLGGSDGFDPAPNLNLKRKKK